MQFDYETKEYEKQVIDSLSNILPPEVACMVFLIENDTIKFICQQLPKEYILEVLNTAITMVKSDSLITDTPPPTTIVPPILLN
jgi:hypothetical protein